MNLRSDNEAPCAPEIMQALMTANAGPAHAYGADHWTMRLDSQFAEVFETQVRVFPMVSGTAANALCVAHACPPYGAVFCHEKAHLHVDECGAPEFYSHGAKLIPLPGDHGRLSADILKERISLLDVDEVHHPRPALVSLTQASECGTVYRTDEIAELCALAHGAGMLAHMDGARFANAVASSSKSPAELSWRAGIDMLSFGATKNGAMAAEAVIFFDPGAAAGFGHRRMKGGHLLSKMRYVSAQLLAYLDNELWLTLARRANEAGRRIGAALQAHPEARVLHPVQINQVFVELSEHLDARLHAAGIQYSPWPGSANRFRMVAPHSVEESQLARFEELLTRD